MQNAEGSGGIHQMRVLIIAAAVLGLPVALVLVLETVAYVKHSGVPPVFYEHSLTRSGSPTWRPCMRVDHEFVLRMDRPRNLLFVTPRRLSGRQAVARQDDGAVVVGFTPGSQVTLANGADQLLVGTADGNVVAFALQPGAVEQVDEAMRERLAGPVEMTIRRALLAVVGDEQMPRVADALGPEK